MGNTRTIVAWNAAALGMVVVLATMGWMEGSGYQWMVERPLWRSVGLGLRTVFGVVMFGVSVRWFVNGRRAAVATACPGPGQLREVQA